MAFSWSVAIVNTQFHHINRDECQHLTNAYRVAHGEKIYRDFWEHHMSGYYHLIAPLMRVSDQPATLYRLARAINPLLWIPGFACLWVLFGRIGWSRLERAALFGTMLQAKPSLSL